jgi:hypothetical protein
MGYLINQMEINQIRFKTSFSIHLQNKLYHSNCFRSGIPYEAVA